MNHLFFNTYPPSGIRFVVPLLALEPVPRPQPASVVRHCSVDVLDFPRSLDRLSPFYPLENIPGPAINKVTKLMWCSVDIDRHEYTRQMHERYGRVVRTGGLSRTFSVY